MNLQPQRSAKQRTSTHNRIIKKTQNQIMATVSKHIWPILKHTMTDQITWKTIEWVVCKNGTCSFMTLLYVNNLY